MGLIEIRFLEGFFKSAKETIKKQVFFLSWDNIRVNKKFCNFLVVCIHGFLYGTTVSQNFCNILVVRANLWCVYHVTEAVQAVIGTYCTYLL